MGESRCCAVLVSEEQDDAIIIEGDKAGKYCVAFDPLDGSSNIDCNVSTGTIFGIYERTSPLGNCPDIKDILRTGNELISAGYCMYGSATDLVLTFGNSGVHRFTLDPTLGEFIHTMGNMRIPDAIHAKTIYSCNEGNYSLWDQPVKDCIDSFKSNNGKPYSLRYVGSMVSDVHRTILYGGIFIYPADSKSKKGKLRILYEGFPMAKIIENAGGLATTGMFKGSIKRVLDLIPEDIHDRCPIVLGCQRDVDRFFIILPLKTNKWSLFFRFQCNGKRKRREKIYPATYPFTHLYLSIYLYRHSSIFFYKCRNEIRKV